MTINSPLLKNEEKCSEKSSVKSKNDNRFAAGYTLFTRNRKTIYYFNKILIKSKKMNNPPLERQQTDRFPTVKKN